MSIYVIINGRLEEHNLPNFFPDFVDSLGLKYGFGLFETIRVKNSTPMYFKEHFLRFMNSTIKIELAFNMSEDKLYNYCIGAMKQNNVSNGVLRFSCIKIDSYGKDKLALIISAMNDSYPFESYSLIRSKYGYFRSNILNYIKSNNYLIHYLSYNYANSKQFDDALLFNEYNNVCETTRFNIFFMKNDNKRIVTPLVSEGLLAGIMRAKIIEVLRESFNIEVIEASINILDMEYYDACFITNSLHFVKPIKMIDCGNTILNYDENNYLIKELYETFA